MSGSARSAELPADEVARRLAQVRDRIAGAGGDPGRVEVVAVTKGFGPWAVRVASAAGLRSVGENYADELLDKAALIAGTGTGTDVEWHYLGSVQRRKVRRLAPVVSCWQALARPEEGEAIAAASPGAAVFVEVDVTGIPGRPGVAPDAAAALVEALRDQGLAVRGLMAVGPPGPPARARSAFRRLAEMAGDLGLSELSAGMTDDLEVAVAEGSTMVRVGRALFGDRPLPVHPTH